MYNAPLASVLWFLPVLMLSVYTWGYFWPAYICCSNVSVPAGSGRYRVVSEPRLSTSSVRPDGKLMVKKFATGMHESWLYTPTTSTELSIFLIISPLIPNPSYLTRFWFFRSPYTNLRYGYTRGVVAGSEWSYYVILSLIHIWRCRRSTLCRSRWSPYH